MYVHIYTKHNPKVNETDLCEVVCKDERRDPRQTRAHNASSPLRRLGKGNLHSCSWESNTCGVRLHLLKKQSVGCKFFAGFKESLRAPGPQ